MSIIFWIVAVILATLLVIHIFLNFVATISTSKKTMWVRKIYWKAIRHQAIKKIAEVNNILSYPMIIFLTFEESPKLVFINEGLEALQKCLSEELEKRAKSLGDAMENPHKYIRDIMKKEDRKRREYKQEYPGSNLGIDDINFIEEFEKQQKDDTHTKHRVT